MLYVKYQDYASDIEMKDQLILQNQSVLKEKDRELYDLQKDFKTLYSKSREL